MFHQLFRSSLLQSTNPFDDNPWGASSSGEAHSRDTFNPFTEVNEIRQQQAQVIRGRSVLYVIVCYTAVAVKYKRTRKTLYTNKSHHSDRSKDDKIAI